MIVVVGAGLAGLVCTHLLGRAGHEVLCIEADSSAGGRIQTQVTRDGYRLDRGFQVLFAAYPALRRHVALSALSPRYFSSSVDIALNGDILKVGHPLYDPQSLRRTVTSGVLGPNDAIAWCRLIAAARTLGDDFLPTSHTTALEALESYGFTSPCIERFLGPLFAGISLDQFLTSDATFLRFVLRSMAVGRVFVPSLGIGQLTQYFVQRLPPKALRLRTRAEALLLDERGVCGVRTKSGEIAARAVVVATDALNAQSLTGVVTPSGSRSSTTVYFASALPLLGTRRLLLNANRSLVNHVAQLSAVAPEYAPPNRHLLAAVVVSDMDVSKNAVAVRVQSDLERWCDASTVRSMDVLDVVRVPYSQYAQPPGVYASQPASKTEIPGLFLAGEYLHSSSVQGAIRGGELAADAVRAALG